MSRVAVAMSGGVDSSTAAAVLALAGQDVVGITMRLTSAGTLPAGATSSRCCSPADIADARRVAAKLSIPHYVFDHGEDFQHEVVRPFIEGYLGGTTPSPCITCNRRIKFDLLWELARSLGATQLATGHYARLDDTGTHPRLLKGLDTAKDQSYFLFDVHPDNLRGVLFPLGGLSKEEVRERARAYGLPVAEKAESYELCFIPDGDKNAFIELNSSSEDRGPGELRHIDGRVLGQHTGIHRFTVGQRRGLNVGGRAGSERLYVVGVRGPQRTVVVGPEKYLYADELIAERCNWISLPPPRSVFRAAARIRHRHPEIQSRITPEKQGSCHVLFDRPQRGVAAGQGVAFYDGELLLGGGWISASHAG